MAGTIQRPQPDYQDRSGGDRLEGWKAIADYLKKTERTVQRWEKNKGLPVRRLEPNSQEEQPRVFAYRLEIDVWWEEQTRLGLDEARTPEAGAVAEQDSKWFSRRYLHYMVPFALGLVLAVVALRIAWPRIQRWRWPPATLTLAILPIKESGGDPESKRIANDLTDELISRVAKLQPGKLVVAEIPSADAGLSANQLGQKFKADYILKGELHRAEGRIAINSQLVDVKQHQVVWGFTESAPMQDVINFEGKVAGAIVGEVSNVLPKNVQPPRVVSRDTSDAYLTGRALSNRRTTDSLKEAIVYFERAIQTDSAYAPAYAGLADCYFLLGSAPYTALPPREAFPKAEAAARKALQLDNTLAEAHVSLGYAELAFEWNYVEAEKEFKRAIELRPNSATAHHYYAYYLTVMNKMDEAILERMKAQELQPDSPLINAALGEAFYEARQFDKTIELARKSLVLDPAYLVALINMGRAYDQMGKHEDALKIYQKIQAALPDEPVIRALLGYNYAVSGNRAKASDVIKQLMEAGKARYVPSLYIAMIYVGLDDKREAFKWLDKAYDERCEYLVFLPTEPMADPLRKDPRFPGLLKRMGLASRKNVTPTSTR
jgi:tetratricopeptide (TPR) repeat protein